MQTFNCVDACHVGDALCVRRWQLDPDRRLIDLHPLGATEVRIVAGGVTISSRGAPELWRKKLKQNGTPVLPVAPSVASGTILRSGKLEDHKRLFCAS